MIVILYKHFLPNKIYDYFISFRVDRPIVMLLYREQCKCTGVYVALEKLHSTCHTSLLFIFSGNIIDKSGRKTKSPLNNIIRKQN